MAVNNLDKREKFTTKKIYYEQKKDNLKSEWYERPEKDVNLVYIDINEEQIIAQSKVIKLSE